MSTLLIRSAVALLALTVPAVVQAQVAGYSPSAGCATCLQPRPVFLYALPRPAFLRYRTRPIADYYPVPYRLTRPVPYVTSHYVTSQAIPRHILMGTPYRGSVVYGRPVGLHGRLGRAARLVVAPTPLPGIASAGTGRPAISGSHQPSTATPPVPAPDPGFADIPRGKNRSTPTAGRSPRRFVKAPSAAAVWQTRRFPIRR